MSGSSSSHGAAAGSASSANSHVFNAELFRIIERVCAAIPAQTQGEVDNFQMHLYRTLAAAPAANIRAALHSPMFAEHLSSLISASLHATDRSLATQIVALDNYDLLAEDLVRLCNISVDSPLADGRLDAAVSVYENCLNAFAASLYDLDQVFGEIIHARFPRQTSDDTSTAFPGSSPSDSPSTAPGALPESDGTSAGTDSSVPLSRSSAAPQVNFRRDFGLGRGRGSVVETSTSRSSPSNYGMGVRQRFRRGVQPDPTPAAGRGRGVVLSGSGAASSSSNFGRGRGVSSDAAVSSSSDDILNQGTLEDPAAAASVSGQFNDLSASDVPRASSSSVGRVISDASDHFPNENF